MKICFQISFKLGKRWFPRKKTSLSTQENNGSQAGNHEKLAECAQQVINKLSERRAKSTIDNYQTALRSLLTYAGKGVRVSDIDATMMEGYQRWLQLRGVGRNTSSCYMRSLRALLHHIAPEENYEKIFKHIFTGNEKTKKRAITMEEIKRLGSPHPASPHWGRSKELRKNTALEMARDFFLFSFCALGMPFVDLAFLKQSQVKDGYIEYRRHKTGQHIRVKIEPPMQHIINRYARKDSPYLFPILTNNNPKQVMREYERKRSKYNRLLNQLAQKTIIPHLTSYVARHSWASIAYSLDVALPIISKAMGHTSTQTTLTYIREINDYRIDEANKGIISPLLTSPPWGRNVPEKRGTSEILYR